MSVFSFGDFYSSHVSVMNEWNTDYFVTKTFINSALKAEFIIGLKNLCTSYSSQKHENCRNQLNFRIL